MKSVKRIFSVEDKPSSFIMAVRAESASFGARVKLIASAPKKIDEIEFFNGEKNEKTAVNEVIDLHLDITDGLGVRVAIGEKELFGGSFKGETDLKKVRSYYEKNRKNEEETESEKEARPIYDDEQIAAKNYYEIEVKDDVDQDPENAFVKGSRQKEQDKNEQLLRPFEDDENAFAGKESDKRSPDGDGAEQNRGSFYERGDKKEDGGLEKLLTVCPKELPLERLIGGRFSRAKDESGKTFIVGKIAACGKTYRLAGVDGVFSSPPDRSGDWFFFPKSPFSLRGEGYFMIITDERGERITGKADRFYRD